MAGTRASMLDAKFKVRSWGLGEGLGLLRVLVFRAEAWGLGFRFLGLGVSEVIFRIGFWGLLYYTYNKEPPTIV